MKLLVQAGFSAHAIAGNLERGDEDRNDGAERQRKEEEGSILRFCAQHMLLIPLNWSQRFKNKLGGNNKMPKPPSHPASWGRCLVSPLMGQQCALCRTGCTRLHQ